MVVTFASVGTVGLCWVALVILSFAGLIKPFVLPTVAMVPAINPGDDVYEESLTYLVRNPKRGDVVVFKTDQIPSLEPHALYVKRLIGLPGDRLSIFKGIFYVNDQPLSLSNRSGPIRCVPDLRSRYLVFNADTLTVPAGQYFVLGDNSANSLDSRFWGFLPARSIEGRAAFCYWPLGHFGSVQ